MSSPSLPGYDNLEMIGKGGFSRVYKADQAKLKRKVAVKVLNFGLNDEADRESFARETELMGRVSAHPNIVTVHDTAFSTEGQPCIVMELYPGGSLADLINEVARLTTREALEVGVAIASALEASHQSGVLHCDLKPQNILISEFGQPALGDFGISTFTEERTQTGNAVGAGFTLPYAAPETVEGESPTIASDVYSLAATLYTSLCGRRPFAYPTAEGAKPAAAEQARRILLEPVPSLEDHGVPAELDALIRQAMAKDPAERPATAAEFANGLHQVGQRLGLGTSQPRIADHGALRSVDADNVGSGQIDLTQLVQQRRERDEVESSGGLAGSFLADESDEVLVDPTPGGRGFEAVESDVVSDSRRQLAAIGAIMAAVVVGLLLFAMSRGGGGDEQRVVPAPAPVLNTVGALDPVMAPGRPTDVQIERAVDHSVLVSWQAPAEDLAAGDVRYEIRRQDGKLAEPLVTLGLQALLPAVADDEAICVTVLAIRGTRTASPTDPVCAPAVNLDVIVSPRNCVAPCSAVLTLVNGANGSTYGVEVMDRELGDMSTFGFTFEPSMEVASNVGQADLMIADETPAGDYLVRMTFPDGVTQTALFTVDSAP